MSNVEQSLLAFSIAAILLVLTPGLDMALVLRVAVSESSKGAFMAAAGIVAGCFVWGLLIALGLGLLIAASTVLYTALKWVGAAYLFFLGIQMIRARRDSVAEASPVAIGKQLEAHVWFGRGLLTNLLNPKVGIFYLSFLPQFIPASSNVAAMTIVLTAIHAALGMAFYVLLVSATERVADILRRPRVIRGLDRTVGTLFVLFAGRLVLQGR